MYFTIEAASGGYRAHCYGANNRLIWWTEVYVNKAGAHAAIALVKTQGPNAQVLDRA